MAQSAQRGRGTTPGFALEDALAGGARIAGIDEVGRGPWAGPVVACAVVLDRRAVPDGLRDSKALTARRRDALSAMLHECAEIGIGACTVDEIDEVGVGRATLVAMRRAFEALPRPPAAALVDGIVAPDLDAAVHTRAKADGLSPSVAAASIVAKVHRDALMGRLHEAHPHYGWARNMGYGTKEHAAGLDAHGVTPHHRRSFAPIAARLAVVRSP